MLKITKLSDYAFIILSYLSEQDIFSAQNIHTNTNIPLATTNKVLKKLLKSNIIISKKGINGGFMLNMAKKDITLLSVIESIEGKFSMIDCLTHKSCSMKKACKIQHQLSNINKEIEKIFHQKTILQLN